MRVHGCSLGLRLIRAKSPMTLLGIGQQDGSFGDQEVGGSRRTADESVELGGALLLRPLGDDGDLDQVPLVPPGGEGALGRRESAGVVPPEVRVERARRREGPVAVAAAEGPFERVPGSAVVFQQSHGPERALAHAALERGLPGVAPAVHVQVGLVGELPAALGARVVPPLAAVRPAHVRLEVRLGHVGLAALAAQKGPLAAEREGRKG